MAKNADTSSSQGYSAARPDKGKQVKVLLEMRRRKGKGKAVAVPEPEDVDLTSASEFEEIIDESPYILASEISEIASESDDSEIVADEDYTFGVSDPCLHSLSTDIAAV